MPLQELVCAKSTVKYRCFKHFRVSTILQFRMKNIYSRSKKLYLLVRCFLKPFWKVKRGLKEAHWACLWIQNRPKKQCKLAMNLYWFLRGSQEGLRHDADLTHPPPRNRVLEHFWSRRAKWPWVFAWFANPRFGHPLNFLFLWFSLPSVTARLADAAGSRGLRHSADPPPPP